MFRLVFTLALAGLLSGLVLVGVYEITLPRIEANQAAALRRAVFEVVPGAARMQRLAWVNGALTTDPAAPESAPSVYAAYDSTGSFVGYAIPSEGAGYQDVIRILYGYDPAAKRVVGMYVLESRETPGLGDKIYKDEEFVAEFDALAIEPEVVLSKEGSDAPNAVDAITGATISSNAVVAIINSGNATWLPRLPGADEAPPLRDGETGGTTASAGGGR